MARAVASENGSRAKKPGRERGREGGMEGGREGRTTKDERATYLRPLVTLHAILVVGAAGLEQGLVRAPATGNDADHLSHKGGEDARGRKRRKGKCEHHHGSQLQVNQATRYLYTYLPSLPTSPLSLPPSLPPFLPPSFLHSPLGPRKIRSSWLLTADGSWSFRGPRPEQLSRRTHRRYGRKCLRREGGREGGKEERREE